MADLLFCVQDPEVERLVLRHSDSQGYARAQSWSPGLLEPPPPRVPVDGPPGTSRAAPPSRSAEASPSGRVEAGRAGQDGRGMRVPAPDAIAVDARGLLLSGPYEPWHQPKREVPGA